MRWIALAFGVPFGLLAIFGIGSVILPHLGISWTPGNMIAAFGIIVLIVAFLVGGNAVRKDKPFITKGWFYLACGLGVACFVLGPTLFVTKALSIRTEVQNLVQNHTAINWQTDTVAILMLLAALVCLGLVIFGGNKKAGD